MINLSPYPTPLVVNLFSPNQFLIRYQFFFCQSVPPSISFCQSVPPIILSSPHRSIREKHKKIMRNRPLPLLLSVHPPQTRLTSLSALHLHKLRRLPDKLLGDGQPLHDVHLNGLLAAQELDPLDDPEAEAAVEFEVERVAAFEVAGAVLGVGLVCFQYRFSPRQYESLLFFWFFGFFGFFFFLKEGKI